LAKKEYAVLHSHWLIPQGFVGAVVARWFGLPHVITVHGSDVLALRGPLLNRIKRWTLQQADAITVNSSQTHEAVLGLGAPTHRVERLPMGISTHGAPNTSRITSIRERYGHEDGPLLAFVGRLVEEKGVGDLIEAIAIIQQQIPSVRAMLVGAGQEHERFEQKVRTLGLEDKVAFVGWVDPVEVPDYLAAADMLIGPSWLEAQGLTFLEAMFVGTPVIATRTGGIVDIVKHEETGLLVQQRQPDQIAEAVWRLYGDPDLSKRIASAGASLAGTHYTWSVCAQRFSDLFLKVKDSR
jgi:glycosyltransferase involved in cell wall biosynthesis